MKEGLNVKTWIRNGTVLTPFRLIPNGGVLVEDGRILAVLQPGESPGSEPMRIIDAGGRYVSPGFIDVHVHGGGGIEVMGSSPAEIARMCTAHSRFGTTSVLPTTLASPIPQLVEAIDAIRAAVPVSTDCNILGVHLEGPFLSVAQCGAQAPDFIRSADKESLQALLDRWDGVKMMGAAPEIPNGYWLGEQLARRGITASIAHSDATFDEAIRALDHGYEDITHIYSGCSSMHRENAYRIAGVVEAGLLDDRFTTQVIADGKHLPPALLKLIYKCKGCDRIVLISDGLAPSAANIRPGDTYLQKNGVLTIMDDGVMKLPGMQSFAGSIATMSDLVRNMIRLAGVPIAEAVRMAAHNPARLIREHHRKGQIAPGMDADITIFDENINIHLTMTEGRIVYDKAKEKEL